MNSEILITNIYFIININYIITLIGLITSKNNFIKIFIWIEALFMTIFINIITHCSIHNILVGNIYILHLSAIIACESAIGLTIVIIYFSQIGTIQIKNENLLKG